MKIVPVTAENIGAVAELATQQGIPRSLNWYKRCLFADSEKSASEVSSRGFAAVRDDGSMAAVQCHHPTFVYYGKTRLSAFQREVMACDHDGSSYLFDIFDACNEHEADVICYNNATANDKSLSLSTKYCGFTTGPKETGMIRFGYVDALACFYYALLAYVHLPQWLFNFVVRTLNPIRVLLHQISFFFAKGKYHIRVDSLEEKMFNKFWREYLSFNQGLVSDRNFAILRDKFSESIDSGNVILLTAKVDDDMCGYVMLRKYCVPNSILTKFEIIDLIASRNDRTVLHVLMKSAIHYAACHYGAKVELVGALPHTEWMNKLLKHSKSLDAISFVYRIKGAAITDSLTRGQGWFFGPYDGERCLGHGGYIDN